MHKNKVDSRNLLLLSYFGQGLMKQATDAMNESRTLDFLANVTFLLFFPCTKLYFSYFLLNSHFFSMTAKYTSIQRNGLRRILCICIEHPSARSTRPMGTTCSLRIRNFREEWKSGNRHRRARFCKPKPAFTFIIFAKNSSFLVSSFLKCLSSWLLSDLYCKSYYAKL